MSENHNEPGQESENAAAQGNSENGLPITRFNFKNRVFHMPGARFIMKGVTHTPTFRVDIGELEGLIEIPILRKEFGIEDGSHDSKLIELAEAGLRFVVDIKPGDEIPTEILTGKASWTVSGKHKKIAEQRLQVQLLSWVSGKEVLLTDPKEIELFLGQIENREKLREAFKDAAVALGFERDNAEPVIKQLELLARELCYIEALRDRYSSIPTILEKMAILSKNLGNDRNAKLELNRVMSLMRTGVREYLAIFEEADAQTGEIISALKSIDRQVAYIRKIRDDLHFLLMQWEPFIKEIPNWRAKRGPDTDRAMSNLYRFLAPRYSAGKSLLKHRTLAAQQAQNQTETAKRGAAKEQQATESKKAPE
ncbi:MAG: hypothetical protein KDE14_13415 [Rhodobacteraceae bacterium]|nr:hypothetical protein [Paracoccaceae bacterium]